MVYDSYTKKYYFKKINKLVDDLSKNGAGEILLQSVDKDGTGFGKKNDRRVNYCRS